MAWSGSYIFTPRVEITSDADNKVIFEHWFDNTRSLTNLVLVWDGVRISVPQSEIIDIDRLQYDTVRIMRGLLVSDNIPLPYRTVSFSFGERHGRDTGYVTIQYIFERQRYAGHRVCIPYNGSYRRNIGEEYYSPYMGGSETDAKTIEDLLQRMKERRSKHLQRVEQHSVAGPNAEPEPQGDGLKLAP